MRIEATLERIAPEPLGMTEAQLEALVRAQVERLRTSTGRKTLLLLLWAPFLRTPRAEIAHDWQVVWGFADRARARLLEGDPDAPDSHLLALALAHLECARSDPDFAEAWSHVNLADALLPRILPEEEWDACTERLRAIDARMEDPIRKLFTRTIAAAPPPVALPGVEGVDEGGGAPPALALHRQQLARAQAWNMMNRVVSLKLALWRSMWIWLWAAIAAVVAMPPVLGWFGVSWMQGERPLALVALLGLFGGTLSAFLNARDAVVEIPSHELITMHTLLRMALGAAGALVVYLLASWLLPDVGRRVATSDFALAGLAIASGFSERLFIAALEQAAENLHLTGTTRKRDEPARPEPAAGTVH